MMMKWVVMAVAMWSVLGADELRLVIVFLRHGARSARKSVSDFEKRFEWPDGRDILTGSGERQHYLLGRMMRKQYVEDKKFLPPQYNESLFNVSATAQDRTIRTAISFLAGLYYCGLDQLSESQVQQESLWTPPIKLTIPDYVKQDLKRSSLPMDLPPIPILSLNRTYDKLLGLHSCPRYYSNRKKYYHTQEFKEVYRKYKKHFLKACGILMMDCSGVKHKHVWDYVDSIVTAAFDHRLPELEAHPKLVHRMDEFYSALEHGELTVEEFMPKAAIYGFSKAIPDCLYQAIRHPKHRMVILSTHESTIMGYLNGMGISLGEFYSTIPYASNLVLELLKKEGGDERDEDAYYVNFTMNGKQLIESMTVQQFHDFLKQKADIAGDWDQICADPKLEVEVEGGSVGPTLAIVGVVSVICLGALAAVIFAWSRAGRAKRWILPDISPTLN